MLIGRYKIRPYGSPQGLSSGFPRQSNTQICPHHKKHIRTSYPNVWAYGTSNTRTILIVAAIHSWPAPCHKPFQNTTNSHTGAGTDMAMVWRSRSMTWQRLTIDTKQYDYDFLNTLTKICQKYLNHVLYTIDISSHHNRYYYIHRRESKTRACYNKLD